MGVPLEYSSIAVLSLYLKVSDRYVFGRWGGGGGGFKYRAKTVIDTLHKLFYVRKLPVSLYIWCVDDNIDILY